MKFYRSIPILLIITVAMLNGYGQVKAPGNGKQNLAVNAAAFPKSKGYVSDFENILDRTTIQTLTDAVTAHEIKTSDEIAVITISSYDPYTNLADYAKDISNAWGVGKHEKNNGVTIVLCRDKREVRIATGMGLEQKLTDTMCQHVIDDKMVPEFRNGNFDQGLIDGLNEIINLLETQ